jgi:uncharacterized membrane protein
MHAYKARPHAILVTVVAGADIDERARHVVATIETGRVVTILNKLHVLLLDLWGVKALTMVGWFCHLFSLQVI